MYGGGPRFILPAVPFRIGSGDAYRAVFRPRFPFFAVQQPSSPGRRGAYVLESTARSTVRAEAPRRFDPAGPESSAVPKRCLRGRAVSGKGHRRGGRSEPSVLPPEREANCTYRCERSPIRVFLTAGSRQMQARVGTSSFVNCARPGAPVTATRTPDGRRAGTLRLGVPTESRERVQLRIFHPSFLREVIDDRSAHSVAV